MSLSLKTKKSVLLIVAYTASNDTGTSGYTFSTELPWRNSLLGQSRFTWVRCKFPAYSFSGGGLTRVHDCGTLDLLSRRRQWHPTPVLLPGKSHGWGSLIGCSSRGHEESYTTERLPFHFSLSCIGEGNGNPLPSSCLENPRDGGAWWAAVYGVARSQTRLK